TLVSAKDEKGPFAMVIGSFGSVSLDPALVQFMPAKGSKTWERIAATGNYCVNVLNEKQLPLSNSFFDKEKDPFNAIEWREGTTGSPIIKDCVAWVDCVIGDIHDAGDHYIVIGEVQEIGCENQTDGPLLFLGGSYGSFTELTES
ncbi:MAG TPA: flavin reductase family protein, partial [Acidimicrobiales bacterium]|nr:flavin reductase family protein [Acidimicrobiales bacterium]